MLPPRAHRLLDALLVTLVLLLVVQTLMGSEGVRGRSAGLAACAAMMLSWLAWRWRGWRWALVLLSSSALISVMFAGGGGVGTLAVVLGLSGVTYGFGVVVGALMVAAFVGVDAGGIWLRHGGGDGVATVVELAGTFLVLMLGVVVGGMLRDLAAERQLNHDLMQQARAAAITEQELMLADERARSARELHDGLGHRITLVVLSLEYAERMRESEPLKAFAELEQARLTAAEALGYLRRWVRALNPPREAAVSGTAAFEAIASSFRGTGLDITVTGSGAERELGRMESLFALRMVQEGLTNVVRHSTASVVHLHLGWSARQLTIALRDDGGAGEGIAPGFGLRSLAERARELGGGLLVRRNAKGVELVGTIPLGEGL